MATFTLIEVRCDRCDEAVTSEWSGTSKTRFRAMLKEFGWRIGKHDVCSLCVKEEKK